MFSQTQKKIELNKQFEKAIAENDIEKVKELFAEGKKEEDMPYLDYEMVSAPAIMIAAQQGNWDMVKELFNLEADLDVRIMPHKWYLINECITNAPDKITKGIIDYSNVNVQNSHGKTPLMIAIERKKGLMAEYLLETDRVELVLCDLKLDNAAHYAAREKNHDLFLKLIAKGVPLLRKNKEGKTPIDLIEDITFRASLPIELEKISNEGGTIILDEESKIESVETVTPVVKKLSGLSSIKKKTS